ncbi:hypothetical protein ACFU7X_29430 [Streptomyces chartreusis]|uniref:hypothetical protein n=1 Tax=Streptomyces chartreusis TaxID=1969 RepID=UPI0036B4F9F0
MDLQLSLTVNDGSRPAYEVRVNDGGMDGGSTCQFLIGGQPGGVTPEALDAAVRAFAETLGAAPNASVVSVNRLTVTGDSL